MKDTDFYQQVLGLEQPWKVGSVDLDLSEGRVVVRLEVECATQWAEDGELLPIHGYETRQWRHLDTMQLETILEARVPRVRRVHRDESGAVESTTTQMVRVPWAEPGSRWTLMFEAWSQQVLKVSQSVEAACQMLRLSWHSAHRIMQRGVDRGLARRTLDEVKRVGLDEKSSRKGHRYITVAVDLSAGRVLEVVPERTTEAACGALSVLSDEQRERVEAACIDMSAAYDAAIAQRLPHAVRVYDRFHVSKLLGEAVDRVRRQEHKQLGAAEAQSVLKGKRYLFLSGMDRLSDERFADLARLLKSNLKTGKAYGYRVHFEEFWQCASRQQAAEFFKVWYRSAIHTRMEPLKKVARTLKAHLDGLLNYFAYPITNAMTEGINSQIQKLKLNARGFRNLNHYRTRILFFLGGLDLSPQTR